MTSGGAVVQRVGEGSDDAEAAAPSTAQRPEQVGVLFGGAVVHVAIGSDDVDREQRVAREPERARHESVAAAEGQTGDADGGAGARRHRDVLRVERVVEVVEAHARTHLDGPGLGVDLDVAKSCDVEYEFGAGRPAAVAVTTAADRDAGAVVTSQPDDRRDVVHVSGLHDGGRRDGVVDRVVQHVGDAEVRVGWGDDPAVDVCRERVERGRVAASGRGGAADARRRRRQPRAAARRRRTGRSGEDRGGLGRRAQELPAVHAPSTGRVRTAGSGCTYAARGPTPASRVGSYLVTSIAHIFRDAGRRTRLGCGRRH